MKKIIVIAALFAMVFSGTALAADWNFYGSARVRWFMTDSSEDVSAASSGYAGYIGNPLAAGNSFQQGQFGVQSNSRIGARVSAGDVGGRFEYGTGVNTRLLYGTWNFGGGEFLAGQFYTPTYYGLSNQVADGDNGLAGFGAPFSRLPGLQLKFGGFKVALVTQGTASTGGTATIAKTNILPKLEAAWNGNAGPVRIHVSGGYTAMEAVDTSDNGQTTTSYLLQAMAKYSAGPFMIGGSVLWGQNVSNYGWNVGPAVAWTATNTGATVYDSTGYGFTIVAGWKINDMLGLEGGYGYILADADAAVAPNDDTAMSYYLQLPITLADGVFIVPEYSKFDYDESNTGAKEGDVSYFGAKFQINF